MQTISATGTINEHRVPEDGVRVDREGDHQTKNDGDDDAGEDAAYREARAQRHHRDRQPRQRRDAGTAAQGHRERDRDHA
jgi:hypothetical protein